MEPIDIVLPNEDNYACILASLVVQAEKAFGNKESALDWLYSKQTSLGDRAPIDLLRTKDGLQAVENLLGCITYGVYR